MIKAGVFIGGMGGIVEEYDLFRQLQPNATIVPVISTGGAVLEVGARMGSLPSELAAERDYVALFHRFLDVSVKEERYRDPDTQPAAIEERFWRPP
jgi:hypothetical protein